MKIKIAPSILSADKKNLQKEVEEIEPYSDLLHVDIMDGNFVPPTTFTAEQIKSIKTRIPKDVHLMVEYPLTGGYMEDFIDAGAYLITVHEECKDDLDEYILYLKGKKIKIGVAINPPTPLDKLNPYLDKVDMVLLMTVNPGYANQKFIESVVPKIKQLRKLKPNLDIEVDGGIKKETIKKAYDAGANIFVAGSSIFGERDRKRAIYDLREAMRMNRSKI